MLVIERKQTKMKTVRRKQVVAVVKRVFGRWRQFREAKDGHANRVVAYLGSDRMIGLARVSLPRRE